MSDHVYICRFEGWNVSGHVYICRFAFCSAFTIIRSDFGFGPTVKYILFSILFGMLQLTITILQISITDLYVVHVEYCGTANYPEINRNSVYSDPESPFPNAM